MEKKQQSNIVCEVIKDLPKELLKKWTVGTITFLVVGVAAVAFGKKTINDLFPGTNSEQNAVKVYARLDSRVSPGETVELYPPSVRQVVSTDREVEWELPFDQITKRTIELQKLGKNTNGGLTRDVLVELKIGEKPTVAFVLR